MARVVRRLRLGGWKGRFAALLFVCAGTANAYEFTDSSRWSFTATDGGGLVQGEPTTLTWSIIPEGEGGSPGSELISFFDDLYPGGSGDDLTLRPWFFIFEQSFLRYQQLSGLTVVYEDDDDGTLPGASFSKRGVLNVRGDIRIRAYGIDGQDGQNTLAQAFFPNYGEMTIDSDNVTYFGNTFNDSRAARNVIMHELGHAIGIDHVESNNEAFLMEPFINLAFDGPQLDDILALHRGYGDVYEKTNGGLGNDVATNATHLGTLIDQFQIGIGVDAADTVVGRYDVDFVSIDDNGDTDFFSFTIDGEADLDITLTPLGPTYNSGPEGGPQSPLDTAVLSDLSLALFDTDGTTLLVDSASALAGQAESIDAFRLEYAGTYYVRITGSENAPQFYQLDLLASYIPPVTGDLNDDGLVDAGDLAIVLGGWGSAVTPGSLMDGDPTGDGLVGVEDLDLVLANWSVPEEAGFAVPEPASAGWLILLGLVAMHRRCQRI